MKNSRLFFAIALLGIVALAHAEEQQSLTRRAGQLDIDFTIALQADSLGTNDAYIYTPYIISRTDTTVLPAVAVYGYKRYVYLKRNHRLPFTGPDETVYRASKAPAEHRYTATMIWQPKLDDCRLMLNTEHIACCNRSKGTTITVIDSIKPYRPLYPFVQPTDIRLPAKTRNLSGSALITFPVGRTEIHDTYMRNARELEKIHASIDSVQGDPDVTITSITIKGYASPESPYANNARLAQGRTNALADYVAGRYGIARRAINVDYEPENWQGLIEYIENNHIPHGYDILDIIAAVSDPDRREAQIKQRFPDVYAALLRDCYPALRRSDYSIDYVIRSYTDIGEIERTLAEHPQNVSLEECYLAASKYEPGSKEFNSIYDTAVRLFPDDPTCNLNAACAAMQRGDLGTAKTFLDKAGNSNEADRAREIYERLMTL